MLLGLHKYFIHKAHKLPWADSQILPIITHILSNLGFHKNTHHIRPQNYTISIKSPKAFTLWEKSKKPNKTLLKTRCYIATLKNPLLHSTSKARCYMAPLKSLLLHDTSKSSLLHGIIFTKSYKVQMLF